MKLHLWNHYSETGMCVSLYNCVLHLAEGRESISVRVSLFVIVCVRERERFYICESICVCVCWAESRSSVFASWAQVTHWRAITAGCPLRGPWCPAGSVCECVRDSRQRADGCLCPAVSVSLFCRWVWFFLLFSSHSSSHSLCFSSHWHFIYSVNLCWLCCFLNDYSFYYFYLDFLCIVTF